MATQMEQDATDVLRFIVEKQQRERPAFELLGDEPPCSATGVEIREATGLSPSRVNDAVALLENSGYAETLRHMGTAPYDFGDVEITALGRYELQRIDADASDAETASASPSSVARSAHPVGSPYGFTEQDWEFIESEKRRTNRIRVVFGHQWESGHYSSVLLRENLCGHFERAVEKLNVEAGTEPVQLVFEPLRAGYGEHLFNEIARKIIAADIAVFDTSDLNPNVMIEMGVALTWGVRVLPIRVDGTDAPPSDISGQTWACYSNDGSTFTDGDHAENLLAMVRRAVVRKSA